MEDLSAGELATARHPYARMLVAAVPDLQTAGDTPLASIPGQPPRPDALPLGCPFSPRCPRATQRCVDELPVLVDEGGGNRVACFHPLEPQEPLVTVEEEVAR